MWPNSLENADLVTYAEEIFNGKLNFLCSYMAKGLWFYVSNFIYRNIIINHVVILQW